MPISCVYGGTPEWMLLVWELAGATSTIAYVAKVCSIEHEVIA